MVVRKSGFDCSKPIAIQIETRVYWLSITEAKDLQNKLFVVLESAKNDLFDKKKEGK